MDKKRHLLKIYILLLIAVLSLYGYSTAVSGVGNKPSNGFGIYENDRQAYNETQDQNIYTLENLPEYFGPPYVEINGNVPLFSETDKKVTDAFETYSELDILGRCGVAYANICREIMPQEERGNIGQVKPSGWHTVKYNGLVDGNYLYNRCHLIGYQLAGENANECNLITGTRYLNTEGMLPFENMVDSYVDLIGNHVLYRVTPIFDGDNLVVSGVEMEGWSVEDGGNGICFHVYCYNVQPGIKIDYATGESLEDMSIRESASKSVNTGQENASEQEYAVMALILNTNTKRIHIPSCPSVSDMAEHNKEEYTGTINGLKEKGYTPCGNCLARYR